MPEKTITHTLIQPGTTLGNIFNPRTIRAKLVRLLILLVLLPSLAFVVTTVILGLRSGQQQVTNQLDAVATYKQQEIDLWVTTQRQEMALELASNTLGVRVYTMQNSPPGSTAYQAAYLAQLIRLNETIKLKSRFYEFSILGTTGQVILSTDPKQEKKDYSNEKFFQEGMKSVFISAPVSDQSQGSSLIFSQPIVYSGKTIGVLTGRANLQYVSEIIPARAGLGQTGEAYLVDINNTAITPLLHPELNNRSDVRTEATIKAFQNKTSGSASYNSYHGQGVIGVYKWLPDLQMVLVAEQTQSEAFAPTYTTLAVNVSVMLIALLVAVLMAILFARNIGDPISHLANAAGQIASGDLSATAPVERLDEIGLLATAFNSMTTQLRQTLEGLELRVAERTTDLEQRSKELADRTVQLELANIRSQKRAAQFQAISDVARTTASVSKLSDLLPRITQVVSEQFGFYHTGVFLVDEANQYAILSAASSEGGNRMLARGHRLKVGDQGIVGYVTEAGIPRISLDTGTDSNFFSNPEMPETRSEMAVPLKSGEEIIGALDVQSSQASAFSQEDVEVMQILADQISIAIINARQFERTQKSLSEVETIYRQYLRREWKHLGKSESILGYRHTIAGTELLEHQYENEKSEQALASGIIQTDVNLENNESTLAVPIKLRDEVLGVLNIRAPGRRAWKTDEINMVKSVADRVAISAENARLFEETTNRAERERTVSEITSKIRSTNDPSEMIQIALNELKQALDIREARIVPYLPPQSQPES